MITNQRIDAIVISTQHDDFDEEATMLAKIKKISLNFDSRIIAKTQQVLIYLMMRLPTISTQQENCNGPHGDNWINVEKC
jgi:S-adenosylmethionine synthetase